MARSVGILKEDSVNPDLQVQHGDYTDMFVSVLGEADPNLRFQIDDVTQFEYPDDLDDCDGYLITGSRHSVYESNESIGRIRC